MRDAGVEKFWEASKAFQHWVEKAFEAVEIYHEQIMVHTKNEPVA